MDAKFVLLLCLSVAAAVAKRPPHKQPVHQQQVHQQVRVADEPTPNHAPAGPAGPHAPADSDGVPRADLEELKQLRAILMDQQVKLTAQEEKLTKQQSKITEHEVKLTEQLQEIEALRNKPRNDDACRRSLTNYVDKAVASAHYKNEVHLNTMEYTCRYGVIDMSCPADGLVVVVSATFGLNHNTSQCPGDECCAPDLARDCVEDMSQYNEAEWTDLRLACNYNNNCGFQFDPHLLSTCGGADQLADYLTITYVCSNDGSTGAAQQVAFTAYNDGTNYYSIFDRIDFDGVVTNVGGHFDNSSTFTCPVDGLYFFSFSIMGDYGYSDTAYITLRHEGSIVVGAYADYYSNEPQSSNTAVMRCGAGEEVYLYCESSTYMHSASDRYVTFSGFLISEN